MTSIAENEDIEDGARSLCAGLSPNPEPRKCPLLLALAEYITPVRQRAAQVVTRLSLCLHTVMVIFALVTIVALFPIFAFLAFNKLCHLTWFLSGLAADDRSTNCTCSCSGKRSRTEPVHTGIQTCDEEGIPQSHCGSKHLGQNSARDQLDDNEKIHDDHESQMKNTEFSDEDKNKEVRDIHTTENPSDLPDHSHHQAQSTEIHTTENPSESSHVQQSLPQPEPSETKPTFSCNIETHEDDDDLHPNHTDPKTTRENSVNSPESEVNKLELSCLLFSPKTARNATKEIPLSSVTESIQAAFESMKRDGKLSSKEDQQKLTTDQVKSSSLGLKKLTKEEEEGAGDPENLTSAAARKSALKRELLSLRQLQSAGSQAEVAVYMCRGPDHHNDTMGVERSRLASFALYASVPESGVWVTQLAEAGFYCPDPASPILRCAFCSLEVDINAFRGRRPQDLHRARSPFCPLLQGLAPNSSMGQESQISSRQFTHDFFSASRQGGGAKVDEATAGHQLGKQDRSPREGRLKRHDDSEKRATEKGRDGGRSPDSFPMVSCDHASVASAESLSTDAPSSLSAMSRSPAPPSSPAMPQVTSPSSLPAVSQVSVSSPGMPQSRAPQSLPALGSFDTSSTSSSTTTNSSNNNNTSTAAYQRVQNSSPQSLAPVSVPSASPTRVAQSPGNITTTNDITSSTTTNTSTTNATSSNTTSTRTTTYNTTNAAATHTITGTTPNTNDSTTNTSNIPTTPSTNASTTTTNTMPFQTARVERPQQQSPLPPAAPANSNTPPQAPPAAGGGSDGQSPGTGNESVRQLVTYAQLGIYTQEPKRPDFAIASARARTFDDRWPHDHSHSPDDMAEAGFYFVGVEDLVRCFYCKGGLKAWSPTLRPWVEHARFYQNCPFVGQVKGQEFIQVVQDLRAGSEEITEERVERELRRRRQISGISDHEGEIPEETTLRHSHGSSLGTTNDGARASDKELEESEEEDSRLEQAAEELENENDEIKNERICKICQVADVSILFLPCGHLVSCSHCAPVLRTCAVCRQRVKGRVRVVENDGYEENATSEATPGSVEGSSETCSRQPNEIFDSRTVK